MSYYNPTDEQCASMGERTIMENQQKQDDRYWRERNLSMNHSQPAAGQISPFSSMSKHPGPQPTARRVEWRLERLPSTPYDGGRKNLNMIPCTIMFMRQDRQGPVLLNDALSNRVELVNERQKLPSDVSAKLSMRIKFVGTPELYHRQIMARRSTRDGEPISLNVLARKIAEETQAYLTQARKTGQPLLHREREVKFEELVLDRLVRVSAGSWVPEFLIWVQVAV